MRISVCQLNPIVGDLDGNAHKIIHALEKAHQEKADIVVFSEMVLCGYPPEDLVLFSDFVSKMERKVEEILHYTKGLFVVFGLVRNNPEKEGKFLFNTAAVCIDGKLAGYKDKTLLPTYDVFNESRYFEPGKEQKVFEYKGKKIGVLICEDMWQHASVLSFNYHRDPVLELQKLKPDLCINISASPYYFQKKDIRAEIFGKLIDTLKCPFVFCNQSGGNDSLVFDGYSMVWNEKKELLSLAKGFSDDHLVVDLQEPAYPLEFPIDPYKDLYRALVLGVKDYFSKQGFTKALLGLSGGIDSALVACVAVDALGPQNVVAIAMPSRFSSLFSFVDGAELAKNLRIELQDIPIDHIFQAFLDLLSPSFRGKPFDEAEENLQARIRGIVLMALSNKHGYIVLSTGNKSEMAMGYSTLYGDMCGGLGVLNDVSKTNVYKLSKWINREKEIIPKSVLEKPPSAELRLNQTDQDSLPDYSIVDAVLEDYVQENLPIDAIVKKQKFDREIVEELVEKIHTAEYKRRQGPPGIRVTKKSFSYGRRLPIVQKWL